ncbi:MAG: nucleotidyltransferase domain-containing protein [Chloroflexota bacterium]|nr:nucleotidyltransferase domain-containing protein [Chloroflexota bacterium]
MLESRQPNYPTPLHLHAAEAIVEFFSEQPGVDAVVLVNSCARGTATVDSDLDVAVLVARDLPDAGRARMENSWRSQYAAQDVYRVFKQSGRFTGVHLDLVDGRFVPEVWDDGGGPDGFELGIGNLFAYGLQLWQGTDAFVELQAEWLPYYDSTLQQQRLEMCRAACEYDLDHVPFFVGRGLYFQAFDRLYKAFQEFLQALFIARRTYPIAYNKWICEQVEQRLGLAALYRQLPQVLEVSKLESAAVLHNADILHGLLEQWAC